MKEQNPPPGIDDDTQGHRVAALDTDADTDDDTQGHKLVKDANAGDDDTEGHRLHH